MYVDAQLTFSDAQAVTAAAGSTNIIDTGPLFSGITGRNLGAGKQFFIAITVDVAFTDSSSDSTLAVTLETDTDVAFGSPVTVGTLGTFAALTAAGTTLFAPMPIGTDAVPYERYIRLKYTPANGNLTTGSLTASIVLDVPNWVSTVGGFSNGL